VVRLQELNGVALMEGLFQWTKNFFQDVAGWPRPATATTIPLDPDRLINEFFRYGSQYYVAGRYAVFAGFMPVAANLLHHAIEMFLKGALAENMAVEKLKDKLGHRLKRAWKEFKTQSADPTLAGFDKVIQRLDRFEVIRYPDVLLRAGGMFSFEITKAGAAMRSSSPGSLPEYVLCLEEIDELVVKILGIANRNPAAFLHFMKPEANEFRGRDNLHLTV
jgi:hypothetical protein